MGSRRRIAGTVLAGSIALAMVPGFAATLGGLSGATIGAGDAAVTACDTNGLSVGCTTASGAVTNVR